VRSRPAYTCSPFKDRFDREYNWRQKREFEHEASNRFKTGTGSGRDVVDMLNAAVPI
jgi:hypothetical protein